MIVLFCCLICLNAHSVFSQLSHPHDLKDKWLLNAAANKNKKISNEWVRVYLATYPRSGNHWHRSLIEEASGIVTSAVYIDKEPLHMTKEFPWGGYCADHGHNGKCRYPVKGESVLVKTHFPSQTNISKFDRLPYHATIRVVRHPVDSIYSRYVKRYSKAAAASPIIPTNRVKEYIKSWQKFQTYWNKKENVFTFLYEDSLINPGPDLKKMCKILKYKVTSEDIERAVSVHPPIGHPLKHLDKFSKDDLKMIERELGPLMKQFGYSIP